MSIHLNDDDAGVVRELIASETYSSADAVVREAIRLLKEKTKRPRPTRPTFRIR